MYSESAAVITRTILESLLFSLDQVPVPVQQLQKVYAPHGTDDPESTYPTPGKLRKDRQKASAAVTLFDKLQKDLTDALSSVESFGPAAVLFLWGTTITSAKSMFIIQLPFLLPSERFSPRLQMDALQIETPLYSDGCSNDATDQTIKAETQFETAALKLNVSGRPKTVSTTKTMANVRNSLSASNISRACVRWIMRHCSLEAIPLLPLHILVNIPIPSDDSERSFLDAWQPRQAIASQLDILAFSCSPSSSARPTRLGLAVHADGSISTLDNCDDLIKAESIWLSWKDRIHGFTD